MPSGLYSGANNANASFNSSESDNPTAIDPLPRNASNKPSSNQWWKGIKSLFSGRDGETNLREAVEEVIQEHEEDGGMRLSREERQMLRNMLSLGELTVYDVMIPRADIAAVEYDITLPELKEAFREKRHTRMPVYEGTLDKLRGFIHLKDLVPTLSGDEPFDLDQVMRQLLFVSPAMRVVDLLGQMRISGSHLAIVVDEYGGTDGLISLEDLFEQIVGEIQDEHDAEHGNEPMLRIVAPHTYEADARTPIEDIEAIVKQLLRCDEGDDYDTLGGYIFSCMGRVPVRAEILNIEHADNADEIIARIEMVEVDARRIHRVRIQLLRQHHVES